MLQPEMLDQIGPGKSNRATRAYELAGFLGGNRLAGRLYSQGRRRRIDIGFLVEHDGSDFSSP